MCCTALILAGSGLSSSAVIRWPTYGTGGWRLGTCWSWAWGCSSMPSQLLCTISHHAPPLRGCHEDVIHDTYGSADTFKRLIHDVLKDFRGAFQSKWEPQRSVPADWCVEGCEEGWSLILFYLEKFWFGIQNWKHFSTRHCWHNLFDGAHQVVLSLYDLIQVTSINADSNLAITYYSYHWTHPFNRLVNFCNIAVIHHLMQLLYNLCLKCSGLVADRMDHTPGIQIDLDLGACTWDLSHSLCSSSACSWHMGFLLLLLWQFHLFLWHFKLLGNVNSFQPLKSISTGAYEHNMLQLHYTLVVEIYHQTNHYHQTAIEILHSSHREDK